jgi:ABC-type multidrug transport system fused ATPase/permease subunit
MDFATKRHYKKMARIYFTIAWSLAITWILYIVACFVIIIVTNVPSHNDNVNFLFFLLFLLPFITAVVLGYIGQEYLNKRIRYKKQINEYRQRRFFTQIIDLLRINNLNDAIVIYEELLTDRNLRKFVFPLLINSLMNSTDENQHNKGVKILNGILEDYNPEKIIF